MPLYSFKIEVVIPLHRKREPKEISLVIPGLVVAPNTEEAEQHAEKIGRGMMRGSRYNEWVDIYQLDLPLGHKVTRKATWTVTSVREVDQVFVQNSSGMNGVYLSAQPTPQPEQHPFCNLSFRGKTPTEL